jgi:hypothetical protein
MSATGTAIQIQHVRPRGAILMSVVLTAALGVGFFIGRATEATTTTTAPEGVSVAIPELGWQTDGAATKGRIYEKTFGVPTAGTGDPTPGGFEPHAPKREPTGDGTIEIGKHQLPERFGL